MKKIEITEELKKQTLATTIFNVNDDNSFYGSVFQSLNIEYVSSIPTAGVKFNNSMKTYELVINPQFFCGVLKQKEREGVFLHEILHLTHRHLIRMPMMSVPPEKRKQLNIAMDLAINQYIKHLPDGCCLLKNFFYKDEKGQKQPFPENKTFEYYFNLLEENPENMEQYEPDKNDVHDWEDGTPTEQDLMDAAEDLFKRALVKSGQGYDQLHGHVKEMFDFIKKRRAELDYRSLLMHALKSSLPANVRKHSWTRTSRRFGNLAPGTKNAEQPKCDNYIDSSGSISIEEANIFLGIVDEFMKVGSRKCTLNLFHTTVYHTQEYKLGQKLTPEIFQSGGTDLTDCFRLIAKRRSDLAVVITDGQYGDVDIKSLVGPHKFPKTLFIISAEGDINHPFSKKDWAITVQIPGKKSK